MCIRDRCRVVDEEGDRDSTPLLLGGELDRKQRRPKRVFPGPLGAGFLPASHEQRTAALAHIDLRNCGALRVEASSRHVRQHDHIKAIDVRERLRKRPWRSNLESKAGVAQRIAEAADPCLVGRDDEHERGFGSKRRRRGGEMRRPLDRRGRAGGARCHGCARRCRGPPWCRLAAAAREREDRRREDREPRPRLHQSRATPECRPALHWMTHGDGRGCARQRAPATRAERDDLPSDIGALVSRGRQLLAEVAADSRAIALPHGRPTPSKPPRSASTPRRDGDLHTMVDVRESSGRTARSSRGGTRCLMSHSASTRLMPQPAPIKTAYVVVSGRPTRSTQGRLVKS